MVLIYLTKIVDRSVNFDLSKQVKGQVMTLLFNVIRVVVATVFAVVTGVILMAVKSQAAEFELCFINFVNLRHFKFGICTLE